MCRTCVICSGLSQLQTCAREIPQLHFGTVTFLAKVWDSEIKWGECKIKFEKIMLCGAYWLHGSPTRVPEALMIIDQQTWHSEVQAVQWILDAWLLSAVGAVGSAFNEISAVFIFTLATLAPCAEKVADWVLELAAAWKLLACNPPGAPRTKLQTCKLTLSTLPRQEAFVLKQAAKELQLDHDGSLMSISGPFWWICDLIMTYKLGGQGQLTTFWGPFWWLQSTQFERSCFQRVLWF